MVRIQYIEHITYKVCVIQIFMVSFGFWSTGIYLVVKFSGESGYKVSGYKVICRFLTAGRGHCPNPHVAQGSNVFYFSFFKFLSLKT